MNREDWTVTTCDTNERDETEMVMLGEGHLAGKVSPKSIDRHRI